MPKRKKSKLGKFNEIPKGETALSTWAPIEITEEKTLVMSDIHAQHHDKVALTTALEYGYKEGVDSILILGDLGDLFSVGCWQKDPNKKDFTQEIITTRYILESMRMGFGDIPIRLKCGNHEDRLKSYLANKAQDLLLTKMEKVLTEFTYPGLIHAEKYGIEVTEEKRRFKIGKLSLLHGHELGRGGYSPVNPARTLFLKTHSHALVGHFHQPSYHPEKTLDGDVIGSWSIGCLCDLHPEWLPVNKWHHGFAVVRLISRKGDFLVDNKTIIKGRIF